MLGEQVQREVDEHVAQTQAPAQTGMTAAHAGVGYAGPAAAALPAPVAVTVAPGETLEGLARRLYGDQWRAGMTLMAADNGLSANQWGSPLIRAGQTLHAPSLAGFDAHQLNHLGRMGGDIVANNARGLNASAQLEALRAQQEAARQAAARQAAPQGMSRDEAYAVYMATGGRSGSFAREMGEAYQPTWHEGRQTVAQPSAPDRDWSQALSDIASRTQGAVAGTLGSFANMVTGTGQVALNSALQVGDLLTFGYSHDHPLIQQAWRDQQRLGQGIVSAILSPRESASAAMESIVNRYNAAMALTNPYAQSAALGELFNDVGQAAAGFGYGAASAARPTAAGISAVGENAFMGPASGGRPAQLGGVSADLGSAPAANTASGGRLTIGDRIDILRDANTGKGNFSLGHASASEANQLGVAWVGPGYRVSQTDGSTLRSADGLRQYRPPSAKPNSPHAATGIQANFQSRDNPSGMWQNNGHLNIR